MDFFKNAKIKAKELSSKAATFAWKELRAAGERSKRYKQEMKGKSDSQLLYSVKREMGTSFLKAAAAHQELRSRGHDAEAIKLMVTKLGGEGG